MGKPCLHRIHSYKAASPVWYSYTLTIQKNCAIAFCVSIFLNLNCQPNFKSICNCITHVLQVWPCHIKTEVAFTPYFALRKESDTIWMELAFSFLMPYTKTCQSVMWAWVCLLMSKDYIDCLLLIDLEYLLMNTYFFIQVIDLNIFNSLPKISCLYILYCWMLV